MSRNELGEKRKRQLCKLEAMYKSLEKSIDNSLIAILSKTDPGRTAHELDTKMILTAAQNLHETTVTIKALSKTIQRLREELYSSKASFEV
ncbi:MULTISPECIES: hypothetical protein [unclassified Prosthecochloris]|uniref:hypothetical protein n=1 Tax=unclassified Prosthecochloris TaxID=2632826 RepID=UPI00223D8BA5|nr:MULTISPECIES: hypothetical protein [unclassified Prosthecochloris]UZJ39168.1 hypothetical protein OO185_04340 [Prosthecochloris sp. SCSIO W1102]